MNRIFKIMGIVALLLTIGQQAFSTEFNPSKVYFKFGESDLKEWFRDNESTLNTLDSTLKEMPSQDISKIQILGSASPEGPEYFNAELSKQRALTMQAYLVSHFGIADSLIEVSSQIAPSDIEQPRDMRFTEIKIILLDKIQQSIVANSANIEIAANLGGGDAKQTLSWWDNLKFWLDDSWLNKMLFIVVILCIFGVIIFVFRKSVSIFKRANLKDSNNGGMPPIPNPDKHNNKGNKDTDNEGWVPTGNDEETLKISPTFKTSGNGVNKEGYTHQDMHENVIQKSLYDKAPDIGKKLIDDAREVRANQPIPEQITAKTIQWKGKKMRMINFGPVSIPGTEVNLPTTNKERLGWLKKNDPATYNNAMANGGKLSTAQVRNINYAISRNEMTKRIMEKYKGSEKEARDIANHPGKYFDSTYHEDPVTHTSYMVPNYYHDASKFGHVGDAALGSQQ